jgi:hypothetical protein
MCISYRDLNPIVSASNLLDITSKLYKKDELHPTTGHEAPEGE